MAIQRTGNFLSEQRLDVSHVRAIESAVRSDFDTSIQSLWTNTSQGYIIRGFRIVTAGAIGAAANGLQMVVDPGAVIHILASVSGTILQVPAGTPNQVLNAATNTNVVGSFTANSTNYVGIDYYRFADSSTNETKYIWNSSADDETTTIAPAAQTMSFTINVSTSVWPSNILPVAIVKTDSNGNVVSISDARFNLYSLETGGINPNPSYVYPWSAGRTQPPVTTTSSSIDPFVGGDKQLDCFKSWADAIMTSLLEIKGTNYWFSGSNSAGPLPTLQSLFQDLGNTVITGSGEISNGILPNSDPLLVTTGTITQTSNQLTALGSVAGIAAGDYIIGTGISQGTTILSISGSTVTMSSQATINGTGINISFYSPSVITAPGQINWDDPIEIRVIGSSLTYTLNANPSSTNVALSDDEAAYITLVRDQPITPNLIFVTGSPTLVSVGGVTWTSGLLAGDYVKVASNTVSDYYQIQSVDSGSQVTLTTNVTSDDGTTSTGAQAQYAFGSYSTSPSPSTNRNIYIASREDVPIAGNVFWLFLREDNGGSPRVYIRFLSQELDNGESISVSGTTSIELLEYIGAPNSASSSPQYVSALTAGSIPEITTIGTTSGSAITGGQYFLINSSGNYRNYYVWFTVNGSGTDPKPPATSGGVVVPILSSDSAAAVATKITTALNATPYKDFSAVAASTNVVVTNTSAGTTTAATAGTTAFAITVTQAGTGVGNYAIKDGDNLTLGVKELDEAVGLIINLLDEPTYDETVEIVASGATPPTSITGPISSGTVITLPNNSRMGGQPQFYTVGKGVLEVYLNGQFLTLNGSWSELGLPESQSNQITILYGLVDGDELQFRININGGNGGLQGPPGTPGATGPAGPTGANAAGGPIPISTKTGNYTVLTSDCFLAVDCSGGPVTLTLPLSSSNLSRIYYIKKIDSTSNPVAIIGTGSDQIDGSGSQLLGGQWMSLSLISNGSNGYWRF